ncbi:hypothetical protein G7Z17_g1460 [Cylindrodendrum hubeiense]|uniref:Major facilitator superfamily (MFS) profile domain-containing protein n=1 Tax=Cylindrodendrum hubeiense TaxID=595255 RepID=A0A9P5HMX9_9HYPO|nr:hypothetical protein G7Z17_g1460 [Cylindrodendrum hubeiense]
MPSLNSGNNLPPIKALNQTNLRETMQSFLQYRRARFEVQAQIDRDLEKAKDAASPSGPNTTQPAHDVTPASVKSSQSCEDDDQESPDSSDEKEHPATDLPIGNIPQIDSDEIEEVYTPVQCSRTVETIRTHYSDGTALGQALTGVHVRDRRTHEGHGGQVFVVDWAGPADPLNPHNWSMLRRIGVTLQISMIALFVGAASGIDATVLPQAAKDFGVSEVAESLATGLYLVGMGLGSLIAGPFSETFGRNAVYTGSFAIFMLFIMASGLSPNFGAQITFRFLAGCSASTPLVCSGGSIADMYNGLEKTWSFPVYAVPAFGGPMIVGWPYIFEYTYHIGQGLANIIFIAMYVGTQINFLFVPIIYKMTNRRNQEAESQGQHHFSPEIRLWYAMFGAAVAIPVSLFWLGWTNYGSISIWSAIFAVVLFGYGVTGIFLCVYMYIIDSYGIYSASALTFVSLIRYVVAGGVTVVGIPFYEKMGTHYTLTIMACLSVVLVPIPYLLYFYGPWIRAKSRFAVAG